MLEQDATSETRRRRRETEGKKARRRQRTKERESASILVACILCLVVLRAVDVRHGIACCSSGAPVRMFIRFAWDDDPLGFLMCAISLGDGRF